MRFNFDYITKDYVIGKLKSSNKNSSKSKDKVLDLFLNKNDIIKIKKLKMIIEAAETNLGLLNEEIASNYLLPNYDIIDTLEYCITPRGKIDFALIDKENKIIVLLELKTSKDTFNSSSMKATEVKLNEAKNFLIQTYPNFNFILKFGYSEEYRDLGGYHFSSKETSKLLIGDESFFEQLKQYYKSLDINLLADVGL